MQWHAYVLNIGETDAPEGLKTALDNTVRLAGMYMDEFREGRSGREIGEKTITKATQAGLRAQLYTHAIGFFGHSAGTTIDTRPLRSVMEETPKIIEYPLHLNTCYAIEFSCTTAVPEWKGADVVISYEENASFTERGCKFIDGNQTELIIIR
jgi:hypothetical protein